MNQKKEHLIEKKLALSNKDWDRLRSLGFDIPTNNFSMIHVIKKLNFYELLRILQDNERFALTLKCINSVGMTIIPGDNGFMIDICDNDKLFAFIEHLKKYLEYNNDCHQELNEYASNRNNNNKAIIIQQ